MIVFNLNLLRRTWHVGFSIPKKYLSKKMREEGFSPDKEKFPTGIGQPNWGFIGRGFEPFPRPDEDPKPTRWWLLIYVVRLGPRTIYRKAHKAWQKFIRRKSSGSDLE
jgi:hypothetical protein